MCRKRSNTEKTNACTYKTKRLEFVINEIARCRHAAACHGYENERRTQTLTNAHGCNINKSKCSSPYAPALNVLCIEVFVISSIRIDTEYTYGIYISVVLCHKNKHLYDEKKRRKKNEIMSTTIIIFDIRLASHISLLALSPVAFRMFVIIVHCSGYTITCILTHHRIWPGQPYYQTLRLFFNAIVLPIVIHTNRVLLLSSSVANNTEALNA